MEKEELNIGDVLSIENIPFPYNLFKYRIIEITEDRIGLEIAEERPDAGKG